MGGGRAFLMLKVLLLLSAAPPRRLYQSSGPLALWRLLHLTRGRCHPPDTQGFHPENFENQKRLWLAEEKQKTDAAAEREVHICRPRNALTDRLAGGADRCHASSQPTHRPHVRAQRNETYLKEQQKAANKCADDDDDAQLTAAAACCWPACSPLSLSHHHVSRARSRLLSGRDEPEKNELGFMYAAPPGLKEKQAKEEEEQARQQQLDHINLGDDREKFLQSIAVRRQPRLSPLFCARCKQLTAGVWPCVTECTERGRAC